MNKVVGTGMETWGEIDNEDLADAEAVDNILLQEFIIQLFNKGVEGYQVVTYRIPG